MVQGVVVQITMLVLSRAALDVVATGKRTKSVVDLCSMYSTSASASAVFSTTDHKTGFEPRNRPPFIRNFPISAAMRASAS